METPGSRSSSGLLLSSESSGRASNEARGRRLLETAAKVFGSYPCRGQQSQESIGDVIGPQAGVHLTDSVVEQSREGALAARGKVWSCVALTVTAMVRSESEAR
jgi:hypothetical protein